MTRVIATFSAKGGAGTSVMTANLAIYLAQKGKKVLLIDAAPNGGSLHAYLNIPSWAVSRTVPDFFSVLPLIDTDYPNLKFFSSLRCPQKHNCVSEYLVKWETELKKSGFDLLFIDMGAHLDGDLIATAYLADLNILFVNPDPVSIEKSNHLLRQFYDAQFEAMLQRLDIAPAVTELQRNRPEHLYSARNLLLAVAEEVPKSRRQVADVVGRLRIGVVFNAIRNSADAELKDIYPLVVRNYFGFDLKGLGDVLYSEVIQNSAQTMTPTVMSERGGEFIEMLDLIAGRVLTHAAKRDHAPVARFLPLTYYEMLGVQRGSSAQDIRAQYEKLRAVYFSQNPLMRDLFDADSLFLYTRLLESVYQNLMDPDIKREYDMGGGQAPETLDQSLPEGFDIREVIRKYNRQKKSGPKLVKRDVFGREAEDVSPLAEKFDEQDPNALFDKYCDRPATGVVLKALREELGLTLKTVCEKTRISHAVVKAIESDDRRNLPALTYLKGFLKSYCRLLRLSEENTERVLTDLVAAATDIPAPPAAPARKQ